jgi:flagellar protein FliO/FliZ
MGLFGAELPIYVQLFLALLIVLGLIGAAAWAVRRFGGAHLGGTVRGRQPRLGVIEYATVDTRRRLLLVRRDNVEHLMLIGGPTDVVVEANIVRAAPATSRDLGGPRIPAAVDNLPRTIPLPEAASNGSWPLQPDEPIIPSAPMAPPRRTSRIESLSEDPLGGAPSHPEPMIRPQREALSALADDLASVAPPVMPTAPPARSRPPAPSRLQPAEPRIEPSRAPAMDAGSADQSLAEMAQRLEAALRKPKAAEVRTPAGPVVDDAEQAEEQMAAPALSPMRSTRPGEMKPTRAEAKPKESKALYDSLEQEMASLLGRPANKN